ncbi:hypothetical protein KIL84_009356 [Mauremys mutica]|uniref:Uncharacterized protein n=1 Tax=Mauremys mutica TaxID=74926 RepID=A0A9D3XK04_9SAUR|nr:hypothetical protein KIL84_009356 [Mauremys mutica]
MAAGLAPACSVPERQPPGAARMKAHKMVVGNVGKPVTGLVLEMYIAHPSELPTELVTLKDLSSAQAMQVFGNSHVAFPARPGQIRAGSWSITADAEQMLTVRLLHMKSCAFTASDCHCGPSMQHGFLAR